jgi:ABC-type oligopeptide transport system ATPase subunit
MTILSVEGLVKEYRRRWQTTFRLEASFTVEHPEIIGVMGPNGSGKTTLFELITGSNTPSAGRVVCMGQDIHGVKARERDRLAIHYHQSYQVRRFRRRKPDFLLERARTPYPAVHLFDEPRFLPIPAQPGPGRVPVPASHRALPPGDPARGLRALHLRREG